jgi:hypothetical protein
LEISDHQQIWGYEEGAGATSADGLLMVADFWLFVIG